jgi:hypothetical protein
MAFFSNPGGDDGALAAQPKLPAVRLYPPAGRGQKEDVRQFKHIHNKTLTRQPSPPPAASIS